MYIVVELNLMSVGIVVHGEYSGIAVRSEYWYSCTIPVELYLASILV